MMSKQFTLLRELCQIKAPSGNEGLMKEFIIEYVHKQSRKWKVQPEIISGEVFQDCLMLKFGNPRTALFAHIDSIGFTVGYNNELIRIGGPVTEDGIGLLGADSLGEIACVLHNDVENGQVRAQYHREIERGTELVFKPHWRETDDYIQCCYMDNRLGVWIALQLAETLEDGLLVFSTYEEHGGGSVGFLTRFMVEQLNIHQALICDITWVTEGILHGNGVVISMRDKGIPRRKYLDKIIGLARESGVPFQLEVESAGSSDGGYIQQSPYPVDWCFIGAPEDHVHSPDEIVHKKDIESMLQLYQFLLKRL
jgi:putative aminopeptidase FrvX